MGGRWGGEGDGWVGDGGGGGNGKKLIPKLIKLN